MAEQLKGIACEVVSVDGLDVIVTQNQGRKLDALDRAMVAELVHAVKGIRSPDSGPMVMTAGQVYHGGTPGPP